MILDLLDKLIKEGGSDKLMDRATKVYRKQKGALLEIKDTKGMAEIIRWFREEKKRCEGLFASSKATAQTMGEYGLVVKFLGYLERMFSEEEAKNLEQAIKDFDKV